MAQMEFNMDGVWVAEMETEHYTWRAVGRTEEEAVLAIENEWAHGRGCERRTPMTREELEEYYGINRWAMIFGQCKWE